ncbi:HAMP domain-containing protein [Spirosoma sp. BT702]|uniref:histidine kinase n=1 Tax=Spirosoma profusum TaxID=2771354 RepID=A0A926XX30_9BACT|nr:ATP-binding protein [Spirosoma profusum]MBD2699467.1 HAMP domain-containing protein [Spirosoma profusum]
MNIRIRLTLLFMLLVASILLLFSFSVYYLYDQFRQQEFQQRLEEKAYTMVRLREDVGEVPQADLPAMVDEQVTIYNSKKVVVYNRGNQRPRFPVSADFLNKTALGQPQYIQEDSIEAVGVRHINLRGEPLLIIASGKDRYGFSKLGRLREILLFGWLLSLGIVGIAGYLFASDALRPVSELIAQVNSISATNIHQRVYVGRQSDELADLAHTFNDLLSRLEEAFILQKSFVSHASHELRTPLTVMMGHIEVTRLQSRSREEYEVTLDALLDEVKSMIRLVNGLLELARARTDTAASTNQPVRIDELLWQAQSLILHNNPDYQINIDFENLPDQEEELVIIGEGSLLQTAFQNLMENGCKYSPDKRVSVGISFERGQVQITFTDQGYGIPRAELSHIFEPFYRSESTMTIKGHGIGLALTQRIIELHKGQIEVKSVVGKGSTFRVTLPIPYGSKADSDDTYKSIEAAKTDS